METTSEASATVKKRLYLGFIQWAALAVTFAYGYSQARTTGVWYTLSGPVVGALGAYLLVGACGALLSLGVAGRMTGGLSALLKRTALLLARQLFADDGYNALSRIVAFYGALWKVLKRVAPATALQLMICGFFKSPLIYVRWYFVGQVVHVLYDHTLHPPSGNVLVTIDFPLGMLIMTMAMSRVIMSVERDALARAERLVPNQLADELALVTRVPGVKSREFYPFIAERRAEVGKKSYKIGKFLVNGCQVLEGIFNLAVLLCVLIWVSPWGGFLALVAVGAMLPILYHDTATVKRSEDQTIVPRAELSAMERFTQDTRVQKLLFGIAKPKVWTSYLAEKRKFISDIKEEMLATGSQRRAVALIVFFTLYSLSALEPLKAAMEGDLGVRVAILYLLSQVSLWTVLPLTAERASRLVEALDDIELIEGVPQTIENFETAEREQLVDDFVLSKRPSSEIEFSDTRFRYHQFRPLVFRVAGNVKTPVTVSMSKDVKVVGAPRSGTSTLLRLIAGDVVPDAHDLENSENSKSVKIGGFSTADFDLSRWVLLVPDEAPDFTGLKVREIFRAVCGSEMSDTEMEAVLRDFDLLDQIKVKGDAFSGLDLLVGYDGRHLTPEQRQLLWLALNYAALKSRKKEYGAFTPSVVAVDGISKLGTLKCRLNVAERFKNLCDEIIATFVCVVRDQREIKEKDFAFTIVDKDDLPPDFADLYGCRAVIGGEHGKRWLCPDKIRQKRYREWHEALADSA